MEISSIGTVIDAPMESEEQKKWALTREQRVEFAKHYISWIKNKPALANNICRSYQMAEAFGNNSIIYMYQGEQWRLPENFARFAVDKNTSWMVVEQLANCFCLSNWQSIGPCPWMDILAVQGKKIKQEKLDDGQSTVDAKDIINVPSMSSSTLSKYDDDVVLLNLETGNPAKVGDKLSLRSTHKLLATVSQNDETDKILSDISNLFQIKLEEGEENLRNPKLPVPDMVLALVPTPDSALDCGDRSEFLTDFELEKLFYLHFGSFNYSTPV